MLNFNFLLLILLSVTDIFATKIEEVFFPICQLNKFVIEHIASYPKDRPQYDVVHLRKWNIWKHNNRMNHYIEYHNPDPEDPHEYDVQIHAPALDFIGLVEQYPNYTAEEHFVETSDGYKLTLHRITKKYNNEPISSNVVYLQHGLFLSSDAYILQGPGKDLVFDLVDKNYDVWLGNARGNAYSRSNSRLSANDSDFWNFSFHEIGIYDLKSSIDYVLEKTSSNQLIYIGYSIGATESYTLLSNYPEYNKKIKLLISISPFAYWEKLNDQDLHKIDHIIKKLEFFRNGSYTGELYPQSSYMQYLAYRNAAILHPKFCKVYLQCFFGEIFSNCDYLSAQLVARHIPAGTSVKTLIHLLQLMKSANFGEYDDGNGSNNYDLSRVTTTHTIFSGINEKFLFKKDVNALQNKFPNSMLHTLKHPTRGYLKEIDYPLARDLKYINKAIKKLLRNA